ncbi:MAG: molybdenum cofactor guanylyltransferase [Thermaceae bacterium]
MYTGAVLAGGRSRRFGKGKALYVWRGRPLLAWVLESLREATYVLAEEVVSRFGPGVYLNANR